ncbi:CesT family type III secretion system chaperone [Burkholderia ubonensis]|uniref:CesT family type III secretion system chaperone n=1 Tax=Burkholderia ubonensis TaxID=101571 RepID=UPI0007574C08|nr:CesT family type III secretion system chaperone [Burkholderia ubonensis]KVP36376.1 molecular chaperone Tir [Burkholderia ubonensis]
MSHDCFVALLYDLCSTVGLGDSNHVIQTKSIEVEGFDVLFDYFDTDQDAIYLNFHFGTVTAGRTLTIFRLMLEANLIIYAQDQAQLGIDVDTGGIVLIVRMRMSSELSGAALADLLSHYAEHGRYWRQNIIESSDEMFEGIVSGDHLWLRA